MLTQAAPMCEYRVVILDPEKRKERRAAALKSTLESMSPAKKIHREMTGGRTPVSEFRMLDEAMQAAKFLLRETESKAIARGLTADDVQVRIAFCDPGFVTAGMERYRADETHERDLRKRLEAQGIIFLGLIFALRDGDEAVAGIKPFLVTPRVVAILGDLAERYEPSN